VHQHKIRQQHRQGLSNNNNKLIQLMHSEAIVNMQALYSKSKRISKAVVIIQYSKMLPSTIINKYNRIVEQEWQIPPEIITLCRTISWVKVVNRKRTRLITSSLPLGIKLTLILFNISSILILTAKVWTQPKTSILLTSQEETCNNNIIRNKVAPLQEMYTHYYI
jgi:hypothetical protein